MGIDKNNIAINSEYFDYDTPTGTKFLIGYRKFIVAIVWLGLMAYGVISVLSILSKPSAGQVTIVVWLIIGCGFFCAFFVGGNVLAKLWAQNYRMATTSTLDQSTRQIEQVLTVVHVDSNEDAAFIDANKKLPEAKSRLKI